MARMLHDSAHMLLKAWEDFAVPQICYAVGTDLSAASRYQFMSNAADINIVCLSGLKSKSDTDI
jgi:hypothetical protein